MISALRPTLLRLRSVRAYADARTVAWPVCWRCAIVLLLVLNLSVFVLIQRTAAFNDRSTQAQQVRLVSREVLTRLVDAETGQRGFLLTARPSTCRSYDEAIAAPAGPVAGTGGPDGRRS